MSNVLTLDRFHSCLHNWTKDHFTTIPYSIDIFQLKWFHSFFPPMYLHHRSQWIKVCDSSWLALKSGNPMCFLSCILIIRMFNKNIFTVWKILWVLNKIQILFLHSSMQTTTCKHKKLNIYKYQSTWKYIYGLQLWTICLLFKTKWWYSSHKSTPRHFF